MSYCIVKYDEQGKGTRIDVLFKILSQAESTAVILRHLDSSCRYEVKLYATDQARAHVP